MYRRDVLMYHFSRIRKHDPNANVYAPLEIRHKGLVGAIIVSCYKPFRKRHDSIHPCRILTIKVVIRAASIRQDGLASGPLVRNTNDVDILTLHD